MDDATTGLALAFLEGRREGREDTPEAVNAKQVREFLGIPNYADQTAANAAEAANVVYFNVDTGKLQITTA